MLGLGRAPPAIRHTYFSFLIALFILASASTRRFGYSMLCFQWLSFWERGWVVLCFRPGLGDDVLWYLPCSSICGLHCTSPTNTRQSQWETVISCAGGQVFLVHLGGALSAMRAVPVAAGCNVKVRSSISISWLRMPWSRGCWLSVTKRSVLCPLGSVHSCCCSVSSLRRTCCHPDGRV